MRYFWYWPYVKLSKWTFWPTMNVCSSMSWGLKKRSSHHPLHYVYWNFMWLLSELVSIHNYIISCKNQLLYLAATEDDNFCNVLKAMISSSLVNEWKTMQLCFKQSWSKGCALKFWYLFVLFNLKIILPLFCLTLFRKHLYLPLRMFWYHSCPWPICLRELLR